MTIAEQLDPPWPGDESESEYQARRRKLLAELSDDDIRDMVCDALDDIMTNLVKQNFIDKDDPRLPEWVAVGVALSERIEAAREAYLEAHE